MVQKVVGLQCWWEFPALNIETLYAIPNIAFFLKEISKRTLVYFVALKENAWTVRR